MIKLIKKIVAIGGGELTDSKHFIIHKEIVKLSSKKHPKVLVIPTASYDSQDCDHIVEKLYKSKLGCRVNYLRLLSQKPTKKQMEDKIFDADVIYVPGGNTLKMMNLWRRLGIDKLLKKAWKKGIVLVGVSAGSICWFDRGHSDSMSFYHPKRWKYINVKGLGFVKGIHCPHYNNQTLEKKRKDYFRLMIKKIGGMGIALDDDCAIAFINDKFRVISARKNSNAHRVFKKNNQMTDEIIIIKKELQPIASLYNK